MTDSIGSKENYSLLQDGIIERLEDADFFIQCMSRNYAILADKWDCWVSLGSRRFREAHNFWREDVDRVKREDMPAETKQLDHFKHASYIAFWLRRMLPIYFTNARPFDSKTAVNKENVGEFFKYGNEIIALLIGFQICLFYESSRVVEHEKGITPIYPDRAAYLRGFKFPHALLHDFATVLKHKNISPHSLYLMYKALFTEMAR